MGGGLHRRRNRHAAARAAIDGPGRVARRRYAAAARIRGRRLSDAGAGARRVALGRHHHRRHCCRVEPHGGRGVLVLRRDSDDVGGICARSLEVAGHLSADAQPRDCGRSCHGVHFLAHRHQAVSRRSSGDRASRHSRGIASPSAPRCSWPSGPGGCADDAWLRRRFVTGFFVLVPLVVSIVALIWVFRVVDGFTAPLYERYFKQYHASDVPRDSGS